MGIGAGGIGAGVVVFGACGFDVAGAGFGLALGTTFFSGILGFSGATIASLILGRTAAFFGGLGGFLLVSKIFCPFSSLL